MRGASQLVAVFTAGVAMSACKPGRVAGPRPADVDAQGLPRTVPPRRAAGEPSLAPLQVFDVYVNPALHPDERHTHDVGIMEFMNHRPPRTGSAYLLVDGRDPLALVTQTVRPDEVAPRFPHPLQRAPRRSLFAIGPVDGTWEELRGARVRTDYGEDARVLGLAYGPEDRERVVVAVDLDADGRDELQLLASGALDLGWKERDPLVRFDLWVDDGHQRRRSEWMLYWSARPRVIMRYECSTGVERTP